MEIYALDQTNIDDFLHLVAAEAAEAIRREEAQGFCVKKEDMHIGALVGRFIAPGDYEILSLYVLPEYRKQGVGAFILETLKEVLGRDANVSITFAAITLDEAALRTFLVTHHFEEYQSQDSHLFAFSLDDLLKTKIYKKGEKPLYPAFSELTSKEKAALKGMRSDGFLPLPSGGLFSDTVDKDVSTAVFQKDQPVGFAVAERYGTDMVALSSLYIKDGEGSEILIKLMRSMMLRAEKAYEKKTVILFPTVNAASEELVTSIFPEDADLEDVMYTYRRFFSQNEEPDYSEESLDDFIFEQKNLFYDPEDEEGKAYSDTVDLTEGDEEPVWLTEG